MYSCWENVQKIIQNVKLTHYAIAEMHSHDFLMIGLEEAKKKKALGWQSNVAHALKLVNTKQSGGTMMSQRNWVCLDVDDAKSIAVYALKKFFCYIFCV